MKKQLILIQIFYSAYYNLGLLFFKTEDLKKSYSFLNEAITIKNDYKFWPDEWIQSYKWEMRGKPTMARVNGVRNFSHPGIPEIKPETSVAVFHGEPYPHNCIDPWCKENWY
mgnify:CR=1 FL=1